MSDLKEFNLDEFKIGKNLYIEASAGTGKTYTIELLVEKMLQNKIPLSKILIVTYTEKAAGELRDRIRKKIISCLENDPNNSIFTKALQEVGNAQIFTFHSFCQNVLNNLAYETKSSLNLELVNDNNIEEIVDKFIRDKWQKISDFKKLLCFSDFKLDDLKSECINAVKQYNLFADLKIEEIDIKKDDKKLLERKFVLKHFHELIDEWQNYKKNNNLISFADMINLVHENVCKNNSFLVERLRDAYRYAIIDEFQDTNQKQWDIFSKIFLKRKNNNIIVVGDPKQSIFSFQGAEIDVYKKAIDEIGNGRRLSTNYRSSVAMIKACNELFKKEDDNNFFNDSEINFIQSEYPSNVDSDVKKAFWNDKETDVEPIWLAKPSDGLEYAKYAVSKIVECLKCDENGKTALQIYDKNEKQMRSVKFSDFAVLARTRSEMPYIEDEMRKVGIPFYRYKDNSLFDGRECKEWISLLMLLDAPDFASYNRRILNQALLTDFFCIELDNVESDEYVNPTKEPMNHILEWRKLSEKRLWAELKERIFEDTKIDDFLSKNSKSSSLVKIRQIANYIFDYLFNHKISIEEMIKHLNGLASKTEEVDSEEDLVENNNDLDSVRVMTIYASKGLEFPIVIMVGSLSGINPFAKGPFVYKEKDKVKYLGFDKFSKDCEDCLEWRRLLYVAYTRANYILILPYFSNKQSWGLDKSFGKIKIDENAPFYFLISRIDKIKSIKYPTLVRTSEENWSEIKEDDKTSENNIKEKETNKNNDAITSINHRYTIDCNNLKNIVKDYINKRNSGENNTASTKGEAENQINSLKIVLPNLRTYQLSYSSISSNLKGKYETFSNNFNYSSFEQPSLQNEEAPQRMVGELDFANQKTEGADCEAIGGVAIQNLDSFSEEMAISEDFGRLDKEDSIDDNLNENESFILEKFKNIDNPENIIKACSNYNSNIKNENDSTDNYPKGSRLGNAIHEIFELIRFENFGKLNEKDIYNNPELNNLIIEHFEKHSLPIKDNKNWQKTTAQIVLNTLNADLPVIHGNEVIDGKTFKLKSLSDNARKSEMEFLFGMDGLEANTLKNLCKGFIDLLFVRKENGIDYYSILDWKSDYMSEESYSDGDALAEKVAEDYTVQRVLYSYLLIKWLKQFYSGLSEEEIFKQHFGGIYYAFVRGCRADSSNGIYAQTWKNYKALEESYRKLVAELGIRS